MKSRKKILCLLLCAAALIAGCAPSAKKMVAEAPLPVVLEAEEVAVIEEAVEEEPPELVIDEAEAEAVTPVDIDELLRAAVRFSEDSLFTEADSVLRRASAFLMYHSVHAESKWLPFQDYVADIVTIYADRMPDRFSTPMDILALIFSQHLLESLLDTIRLSPSDSIFFTRLSNKRGVTYDVPMVWNDRVRRALMFYTRTRRGVFDRWLNRAGYYLPLMREMYAEAGLPQDLAYLPIIESGFNPHAYSRAHAAGIWQFIPSTGRHYGLRQNYWIDERRDPIKSTRASIAYLSKLYRDFGDWHIALASYNCGENGMARAIRRAGGVRDYWQLTLPKETMNYIPLYLASVIIAKNPDVFEFAIQDTLVFDLDTVYVHDCIQLSIIAEGVGVPLDVLQRINPHILHWSTPPDMRDVLLYLPNGYGDRFREFYAELPDEKKTRFHRYRVQSGDNLMQIARNFGVPVEAIRDINNMRNNHITAGRHIIIPVPLNETIPASMAAHLNANERQQAGRNRTPASSAPQTAAPRTGQRITYKVRAGETLYSISNLFGVSVNDLMSWNYMSNPRHLKAEQTLVIYRADPSSATPAAPPAPQSQPQAQPAQRTTAPSGHTGKHLVRQGETLYGISREIGVPVNELARINGLDPRRPLIFPGDVLVYTPRTGQGGTATNQGETGSAQ
ncbi:MAG: LysM peptidoglycan-binding domain-containing protein [Chitinispirillales bacterium]|jgi:membrane-bound lytic murein transglycosylase D|nr:LysM peptidoglycan-binding domain-containing protein [Chitinispirillales bacterium]